MEMGVNRGQPPGSVPAQGYQTLAGQEYIQAYSDEGSYYPGQCPQQGVMYHPNQPSKMSPNQSLAYHKHGAVAFQANPDQMQYIAKKGVFMGDCVQPMGVYNMRQPTQHSTVMFPANGVSATQTLHINPGIGTQQGNYMIRSMMPGHSNNQVQFQGAMVYQGQGQVQQRMMWYQEPGLSSPGSMPVRFSANHGTQPIQMMSPPPQNMMMSPQQQQQQQQLHHMMLSPGQGAAPSGSINSMWVMGQRLQHYSPEQAVPGGATCPSSPGYQPRPPHFHQYRPRVKSQHSAVAHGTTSVKYSSPTLQASPSIPYSQALEGYPSPGHTPLPCTQTTLAPPSGGDYENTVQTGLPISSQAHGTCVYTIANTQMFHGTTVSTGSVMLANHSTSSATGSIMSSNERPGSRTSSSGQSVVNTGNADQIKTVNDHVCSSGRVSSQSGDWDESPDRGRRGSPKQLGSTEWQSSGENASELSSASADVKMVDAGVVTDETSDRICMQRSYSCAMSKPDHSSSSMVLSCGQSAITGTSANRRSPPIASSSVDNGESEASDVSEVVVPFGWKRVIENDTVAYYSPSNTRLDCPAAVTEYVMKDGTCKCGLSCPLLIGKAFNFDPDVVSVEWSADNVGHNDNLNNLCNHKRKMIAMATLQTTSNLQMPAQFGCGQQAASKGLEVLSLNKKDGTKKKKAKVKGGSGMNPYDGMLVSQLLMHRDKLREHGMNPLQAHPPYLECSGGQLTPDGDDGAKLNTSNSGMIPKRGSEPKREDVSVMGQMSSSDAVRTSTDGRSLQHMQFDESTGADTKYMLDTQGAGGMNQIAGSLRGLYQSHGSLDMIMGVHQKGSEDQVGSACLNPLSYGRQKGCMPPAGQMFSLQLQMQAQVAAARNSGSGHRCGVMSPAPSSHSQQSSPSPGHHHVHGRVTEVVSASPLNTTSTSPTTSLGVHQVPVKASCPNAYAAPLLQSSSAAPQSNQPQVKKRKKKRKRDIFNKAMSGLLEKNMPCPNVDVRQFSDKMNSGPGFAPLGLSTFTGSHTQGEKVTSFMENPAAFLAQQAEMVTNKMKTTLTENVPFAKVTKQEVVSKEDSLEHLLEMNGTGAEQVSAQKSAIDDETQHTEDTDHNKSSLSNDDSQYGHSSVSSHQEVMGGLSSQDSASSGGVVVGEKAAVNHSSKEFPASCLLTAAARAKLAQPASNSWRFRIPLGPTPIRHVPPGGQHIGGGSIVYHHKIENQQAFHEGGIVNGGGILMVTSPVHRGDSLTVNCMPSVPYMLQDAVANKGIHLLGDLVQNIGTAAEGRSVVNVSDTAVIYNLLQCSMNEELQSRLAVISSKEQLSGAVGLVQSSSSCTAGVGKICGSSELMGNVQAVQVSEEGSKDSIPLKGVPESQVNGLMLSQVSRKVAMTTLNLPMPPLPDSAVTAVTDSITQVIPASGLQSLGCVQSSQTRITSNMVQLNMIIDAGNADSIKTDMGATEMRARTPCEHEDTECLVKEETPSAFEDVNSNKHDSCCQASEGMNNTGVTQTVVAQAGNDHRPVGSLKTKLCLRVARKKKKKKRKKQKEESSKGQECVIKVEQMPLVNSCEHDVKEDQVEAGTATEMDVSDEPNGSVEVEQDLEHPIADDGALMMTAYQNEAFPMSQSELLDSSQIVLDHSQGLHQPYIHTQGQEVGPVCFSSPGHVGTNQGEGATQTEAANVIQTVSFLPNMVGIDPNTGLVQSIHMPLPGGPGGGKEQHAMSTEQTSPLAQSQIVQTIMQSLHIQNNVLVQGVTPGAVSGAFLQPLSAVGNALIPVFQSPVAVGANCEEAALSVMSVTPVTNSGEVPPTYVESQKKSCNVVSTQTEAVQTEDSCSDLMDAEGGGRLLVEYEDSILADDSYILENGEVEQSTAMDTNRTNEENSEQALMEKSVTRSSPEALNSVESSSSLCENGLSQSSDDLVRGHGTDESLSGADVPVASSGGCDAGESKSEIDVSIHSVSDDTSASQKLCENGAGKQPLTGRPLKAGDGQTAGVMSVQCVADQSLSDTGEEVLSSVQSDSSSSVPLQQVAADGVVQTDSAPDSVTMPVLSRESSITGDTVRATDLGECRPGSALDQIHTRLECALRHYLKDEVDQSHSGTCQTEFSSRQKNQVANSDVIKEDGRVELSGNVIKEDHFGDPPNLPVMTRLGRASKKRPFFQKGRCGRFKKKSRKVIRNGLCGLLAGQRHGLSQQRNVSCDKTVAVPKSEDVPKEAVPLNNNKPVGDLLEAGSLPSGGLPKEKRGQESDIDRSAESGVTEKQGKNSVSSTSGSSDVEANQSSDSSQSMSTSEGDEVRCGNSPAIRCSNLLTSSPETGEINCAALTDFDKLENIYTEGTTNHIAPAVKQMKTRRSLKSELDNLLPDHGIKRSFCDRKEEEAGNADHSSCSPSPDPGYVRTLCPGELIWGPVKTFPSWPGKLVSYDDVPKNPKSEDGKLWVHWFGFHTYSQVEPQQLKTLTEGLEAHHSARQKHRKGRKLNSSLEAAIQEAMLELDRQMEQDSQSAISGNITMDTKVSKVSNKKKKLR